MNRRAVVVLVCGLCLVLSGAALIRQALPLSAASHSVVEPWQPGDPEFGEPMPHPPIVGSNYHGMWDDMTAETRARTLDELAAAGVQWVRLDIAWAQLQPTSRADFDLSWGVPRIDERIAEITARGMKVLLLVYWGPPWATGTTDRNGVPADPEDFAAAAAWAAQRWRGQVQAIELWNEPDLSSFLANTSPTTYTALVTAAYRRIKAVNPDVTVVAGAPTYVNTEWFTQFYANGGADHYDALGIHPYVGRSDLPPEACPGAPDVEYYPCNITNLIDLMRTNGDGDKAIWVTEYGWSVHDNRADERPWQRGVSEQQQAEYLLRMQRFLGQWPQVEASFWYTDRDTARGDVHEDGFGLLTRDFGRRPAYYALKCAATGICGPASDTVEPGPSEVPSQAGL